MLETQIVAGIEPRSLTPRQVAREFLGLIEGGGVIRAVGGAKDDPLSLLSLGYTPKHKLELFGAAFYLTNLRIEQNFRFFVAYVVLGHGSGTRRIEAHPRIFYKDSSLVWRSPTHVIRSDDENWIGKGDLRTVIIDGEEIEYGAEETTNLPLEIQSALDIISRRGSAGRDRRAIELILREAPDGRFEPYQDFSRPRRRARAEPANLIHGGKPIATFTRPNDPTSLKIAVGYEPDFQRGLIERSELRSRLYGGRIQKFRILSRNREIQYQFIAGPHHVWIIPPQALTTELMSYGVRTIDVEVDEDLCVPGYEYHYIDDTEDPPRLHSQIPKGFAGKASEFDPFRADASPWLEKIQIIREFREAFGPDLVTEPLGQDARNP